MEEAHDFASEINRKKERHKDKLVREIQQKLNAIFPSKSDEEEMAISSRRDNLVFGS